MKVAFYKERGTKFDQLIRWWTRSPYSHAELVFSNGLWFSSSPRDGGVRFKRIDPNPDKWDFVEVTAEMLGGATPAALGVTERLVELTARQEVGRSYDWLGILGFVAPFGEHDDHDLFCSEAVVRVLQAAELFPKVRPYKVSPGKLHTMLRNLRGDS